MRRIKKEGTDVGITMIACCTLKMISTETSVVPLRGDCVDMHSYSKGPARPKRCLLARRHLHHTPEHHDRQGKLQFCCFNISPLLAARRVVVSAEVNDLVIVHNEHVDEFIGGQQPFSLFMTGPKECHTTRPVQSPPHLLCAGCMLLHKRSHSRSK